uniref:G-protein coupled receptors family 1 profile domain-containing protein n=1 Tax=Globodera rostochiensis TaxID=31243 RepID=A0A914I762_GLORO
MPTPAQLFEGEAEGNCALDIFPDRRWYLVAVLGTFLSAISLVCNALIACVLLRPRNSNFFFLGLLALSDAFLSACYGPVIAMDIIKNRVQLLWLSRLWWSYVGPLLALCHVSMTFSCLMIILGCYERFLITLKSPQLACFRNNRAQLALCALCLSIVLRGTSIFEVELVRNGNCTGLTEFEPQLSLLAENWMYGTIFRFYIRTIATVFVPFFFLAYLNTRIVLRLRKQKRSAAMFRFGGAYDHKLRVRSATRLLVLIVCSYLLANFPNVFITAWEYLDLASTQSEHYYDIYETITDVISMLYVLSCASRLAIYLSCNEELRFAFCDFLCASCDGRAKDGNGTRALQRHNSSCRPTSTTMYTPVSRRYSLRHHQSSELPQIGTDFDRVVVAMAISRVSSSLISREKAPEGNDERTNPEGAIGLDKGEATADESCRLTIGLRANGNI